LEEDEGCAAGLVEGFFLSGSAAEPVLLCFSGESDCEELAACGRKRALRAPSGNAHTAASASKNHHLRPNCTTLLFSRGDANQNLLEEFTQTTCEIYLRNPAPITVKSSSARLRNTSF